MKLVSFVIAGTLLAGCAAQKVQIAPVRVEPIHVTIDVNLHDVAKSDTAKTVKR